MVFMMNTKFLVEVVSEAPNQTLIIYLLTINNYERYINSNGGHFKYYADISTFKITEYTDSTKIDENALVLIVECDTTEYCHYSSAGKTQSHVCVYPSCTYNLEYGTEMLSYNTDFDNYIETHSTSFRHIPNTLFLVLLPLLFA